jgi:PAS domain S-box-containing protein
MNPLDSPTPSNEERYRILSELTSDYAYSFRVDNAEEYQAEWLSPSFTQVTGYSQEEIAASGWELLVHPEDRHIADEHVLKVMSGAQDEAVFRIRNRAGEIRWIRNRAKPIWDEEQQRVIRIYGASADITESKRAQDIVKEQSDQIRLIADAAPVLISYIDSDERYRFVNQTYTEWFGISTEDLIGKTVIELVGPELYARIKPYINLALAGQTVAFETPMWGRGGFIRETSVAYKPDVDPDGTVRGFVTAVTDITERKQSEAALRENEALERQFQARLRILLDIGNALSEKPTVDEVCRLAVELGRSRLGFDRLGIWFRTDVSDEIQGSYGIDEAGSIRDERHSRIKVGPDSTMGKIMNDGMPSFSEEDAPVFNDKREIVGRGWHGVGAMWDGREIVGCISADNLLHHRPVPQKQLEILTLFASMLGHLCTRKRTEESLKAHQEDILELNEKLQRAMTETHHRVKNNLQVIAAMIDMRIMDGAGTVSIEELQMLSAHVRTLATVHDLLTQQAKAHGDAREISAAEVLERLLALMGETTGGRSIQAQITDATLTPKQATSMGLVLNELVSNAIKYGKGDIEVSFQTNEENALLRISDNGPGFPPAFDAKNGSNTGLDLVDNLSHWDLGGHICYENRQEGGAQITVTFPLTL